MRGRFVLEEIIERLFLVGAVVVWCYFWIDEGNLWERCYGKIVWLFYLKICKELWVFVKMLWGIFDKFEIFYFDW